MEILALVSAFVLVGLNAFFVATEFAIVKVRPTRIEELIAKGRPGAGSVRRVLANLDRYLSATQLGITLASLGLGWIGEPAFARLLERPLAAVGVVDPHWVHNIALGSAFALITTLHIVLGELAPKTLAILRAETVALAAAYPIRFFYGVFFPGIWALNGLANLALRIFGVRGGVHAEYHSEEELKIILTQARSAGLLGPSRADVLARALTLPTKTARHLMVPRNEVVVLDVNLPWDENLSRAVEAGYTRYPLCDRELDDVIGIVDIREALHEAHKKGAVALRSLARPALYFPEVMSAERLLSDFRARGVKMAVVVDEYGGASGIVTAADVVTAVMGEFHHEHEAAEVVQLPSGVFEVEGTATLDEVSEALGIELSAESVHTIAGFLMERLGRMPRGGDRVVEQGYAFLVVEVVGPRVKTLRIQPDRAEPSGTKGTRPPPSDQPTLR